MNAPRGGWITVSAWIFTDWEQCLGIDNMVPVNSRVWGPDLGFLQARSLHRTRLISNQIVSSRPSSASALWFILTHFVMFSLGGTQQTHLAFNTLWQTQVQPFTRTAVKGNNSSRIFISLKILWLLSDNWKGPWIVQRAHSYYKITDYTILQLRSQRRWTQIASGPGSLQM